MTLSDLDSRGGSVRVPWARTAWIRAQRLGVVQAVSDRLPDAHAVELQPLTGQRSFAFEGAEGARPPARMWALSERRPGARSWSKS